MVDLPLQTACGGAQPLNSAGEGLGGRARLAMLCVACQTRWARVLSVRLDAVAPTKLWRHII
eukprot:2784271-Pleurochrysis_carterae.AAC.4